MLQAQTPPLKAHNAAPVIQVEITMKVPVERKQHLCAVDKVILLGHWDNAELKELLHRPVLPKTIHSFLSSTFTDTAEELNWIL